MLQREKQAREDAEKERALLKERMEKYEVESKKAMEGIPVPVASLYPSQ